MVQNGWHYEVWGASDDPSTWLEQNITLLQKGQQTPQRKLQRRQVTKQMKQVVEEVEKAKNLTQRHGVTFYDSTISQAKDQLFCGQMHISGGDEPDGTGIAPKSTSSGYLVLGLRD